MFRSFSIERKKVHTIVFKYKILSPIKPPFENWESPSALRDICGTASDLLNLKICARIFSRWRERWVLKREVEKNIDVRWQFSWKSPRKHQVVLDDFVSWWYFLPSQPKTGCRIYAPSKWLSFPCRNPIPPFSRLGCTWEVVYYWFLFDCSSMLTTFKWATHCLHSKKRTWIMKHSTCHPILMPTPYSNDL